MLKKIQIIFFLFLFSLLLNSQEESFYCKLIYENDVNEYNLCSKIIKDTSFYYFLNLTLGFGLGSFIQRDFYNAILGLNIDIFSISTIAIGSFLYYKESLRNFNIIAISFGVLTFILNKIYMSVIPYFFEKYKKYNKSLSNNGLETLFSINLSHKDGYNFILGFKNIY